MLVVVGGSFYVYPALGSQERDAAAVAAENVQGVLSLEGVIHAQLALALIQSECFQCFYEHDILENI